MSLYSEVRLLLDLRAALVPACSRLGCLPTREAYDRSLPSSQWLSRPPTSQNQHEVRDRRVPGWSSSLPSPRRRHPNFHLHMLRRRIARTGTGEWCNRSRSYGRLNERQVVLEKEHRGLAAATARDEMGVELQSCSFASRFLSSEDRCVAIPGC
jgi:hypothetical protein